MAAATGAAQEGQESPNLADQADLHSVSGSSSRQPSPVTSLDLQKAPDASERPVREQLMKTSIAGDDNVPSALDITKPEDTLSEADSIHTDAGKSDKDGETDSTRGRPRRKRSFEELDGDHAERAGTSSSKHLRKRSRESDNPGLDNEELRNAAARAKSPRKNPVEPVDEPEEQGQSTIVETESSERPVTPISGLAKQSLPSDDMAISPPNKRSRDQFVKDHDASSEKVTAHGEVTEEKDEASADKEASTIPKTTYDEPDSKRPRDGTAVQSSEKESVGPTKIPPSSGFANTSTPSPFSGLASPKSPSLQPQTSTSAFASSGFASFASSAKSPFGTFGSSKASEDTKDKPEATKHDSAPLSGFGALGGTGPSPFAAATAPSVFGSQSSSGFANLSNGLGGAGGFGSKTLSSFASAGGSGIIGASSKASRPIGVSADADDEDGDTSANEEGREDGETGGTSVDDDDKDSRFYEQEVETGEEGEQTVFNSRAKLYVSQEKQWKERGVGSFKVNVAYNSDSSNGEDSEPKKSARFIMRADGSHRIVLNSPIKKQITIEDPTGGPPKGKTAIFLGFIDNKPTMMQLKMRSNVQTGELHSVVTTLQETL